MHATIMKHAGLQVAPGQRCSVVSPNNSLRLAPARGSPYSTPLTTTHEQLQQQHPAPADAAAAPIAPTAAPSTTSPNVQPRVPVVPRQPAAAMPQPTGSGHFAQDYALAEAGFMQLLRTADLDLKVAPGSYLNDPNITSQANALDAMVAAAMEAAYGRKHAQRGLPLLPTAFLSSPSLGSTSDAQLPQQSMVQGGAPWDSMDSAVAQPGMAGNPTADGAAKSSSKPNGVQAADSTWVEEMYAKAGSPEDAAHLFLQRVLYHINRLNLFWYDALSNYENERSLHLARLRDAIEAAWTCWEAEQLGHDTINTFKQMSPAELKAALQSLYTQDVEPPLSDVGRYISHEMGVEGYRQLLAIASLDGLVEASRQSRVCGGAPNDIMCMIFKVLTEEYGNGRMAKKHSTFFAAMMKELKLCEQPEAYLHLVPWQVLAGANHNFLLTERRRHYLRYAGGLTFFEIVGPSVYRTYLAAAQRLNLSDQAAGYWALHIKEDERHGRWMVEDVAVPLVDWYPADGWEVVLGYQQEKSMAGRAASVVLQRIREADEKGFTAQPVFSTSAPAVRVEAAQEHLAAANV